MNAGAIIAGQQIGNQVRKAEERKKLEQIQAQRTQQQIFCYPPDQYTPGSQTPYMPVSQALDVFTSQIPFQNQPLTYQQALFCSHQISFQTLIGT